MPAINTKFANAAKRKLQTEATQKATPTKALKPTASTATKKITNKASATLPAALPEHITTEFLKTNYLTEMQVRELLGFSRTTLWKLRKEKKLNATKESRRNVYALSELARFRENGTGEGG